MTRHLRTFSLFPILFQTSSRFFAKLITTSKPLPTGLAKVRCPLFDPLACIMGCANYHRRGFQGAPNNGFPVLAKRRSGRVRRGRRRAKTRKRTEDGTRRGATRLAAHEAHARDVEAAVARAALAEVDTARPTVAMRRLQLRNQQHRLLRRLEMRSPPMRGAWMPHTTLLVVGVAKPHHPPRLRLSRRPARQALMPLRASGRTVYRLIRLHNSRPQRPALR